MPEKQRRNDKYLPITVVLQVVIGLALSLVTWFAKENYQSAMSRLAALEDKHANLREDYLETRYAVSSLRPATNPRARH
jgi:hypothetical protein